MCNGSEAGSYLRLMDFVYHSTLVLRVIKKRKKPNVSIRYGSMMFLPRERAPYKVNSVGGKVTFRPLF